MTNTATFFTVERSDPSLTPPGFTFVTVKSPALNRRADLLIFVPEGCELPEDAPLVILLHGVYGSHWAWAFRGGVHGVLNSLVASNRSAPFVLAMPSDGLWRDGSGYVPHQDADYEQWIAREVPEAVRMTVPRVSERSPTFISGLSMGGYGAFFVGARNPDVFLGVSALSSITCWEDFRLFYEGGDLSQLTESALVRTDIIDLLRSCKGKLPYMRFDCGTSDTLIDANRSLHAALTEASIPHTYEEFPGSHSWEYWTSHIGDSFCFFTQMLR